METMLIDEKKVEELIEKTVQKHFKLTFENVEEVRKSPAVTLIRIEDRLDALDARIARDMVTRAEHAATRAELKEEIASLRTEFKEEIANLRTEFEEEATNIRTEVKVEAANTRTEVKVEAANTRTELKTELKDEIAQIRIDLKDEIWKLRLWIIVLAIIVILTNPKVIELISKLFSVFKP